MSIIVMPAKNNRYSERIEDVCSVIVSASTGDGKRLKVQAKTKNISAGGLFMYVPYLLIHCDILFVFIQLPYGARLAAISRVLRTENKGNELLGVALCFERIRLFPERLSINKGWECKSTNKFDL
jgi:hypothetical protein